MMKLDCRDIFSLHLVISESIFKLRKLIFCTLNFSDERVWLCMGSKRNARNRNGHQHLKRKKTKSTHFISGGDFPSHCFVSDVKWCPYDVSSQQIDFPMENDNFQQPLKWFCTKIRLGGPLLTPSWLNLLIMVQGRSVFSLSNQHVEERL